MDTQTVLKIKVDKKLDLSDTDLDSVKYLLGEYKEWKQLKNTRL